MWFYMSDLTDTIKREKEASFNNLSTKRILWDNAEKLFHNQLNDLNSGNTNSRVFDPKLSTLIIERGYRVMAQLATGKVKGISNNDLGDAKLKNLLLDKYVIPNANSQFDFLTKLRMVDIYSNIYGAFCVLIDQEVKKNGYIGPDMWLLNIRDIFPQVGAVSLDDSDSVIIRTWRRKSYFEGLSKDKGFKNIGKIVELLNDKAGSLHERDSSNNSQRGERQYPQQQPAKGQGYYEVLTRFERDRWVDMCVDADEVFRDQANPHGNEELPVKCKYSIPLLDDPMGMGDVERGGSMQMVINSNWNLYLDAVKMSIFPPMLINKDNVASPSSFKSVPGATWLGRGQLNNIAQAVNLSPQGISTFNNVYQVANASLQNLFGTSNTDVPASTDQSQGKTPQALRMQSQRENTRDNADRFYMEQFVTSVMKTMVNLLSKKQSKAVTFRMFPDEIDQLAREYPEIKELYNDKTGKVTVKKGKGSTLYDYEIISGSTYAIDQKSQQENMQMLLQLFMQSQTPNGNTLVQTLAQEGYTFKFGELFKRIISNSGITEWDKILEEMTDGEMADRTAEAHGQELNQLFESMKTVGQQNMNAVPPMPPQQQQPMPQQQQPMQQQQPNGMAGF